jgi:hypothetical protein
MNLNDASLIAQIISAVIVVLTFVGLIVSLRQNTRAQRTVSVESLTAAITAINVPAMQSSALGEALVAVRADWWGATREQRITAHYFLFSFYKLIEQAWFQRRAGVLPEAQWQGWEMLLTVYCHSPGIANDWWPRRQFAYSREFREHLAQIPRSPEIGELGDIFGPRPTEGVQISDASSTPP